MIKPMLFLYILAMLSAASANERDLYAAARGIKNNPVLKGGLWSTTVIDARSGEIILEMDSYRKMSPASNLKLVTAAAALCLLGPEATFTTTLEYSGTVNREGVLHGDLYIRGGGDPSLGSAAVNGGFTLPGLLELWVHQIRQHGIRSIKGNIVGDDLYLDHFPLPGGWSWSDIGNYYAAGTSGLCINENLYQLYFKPGKKPGDPARVLRTQPQVPDLQFLNHMRTGPKGSGDNGYIYGAPWQYLHQLEGTIPAGVAEFSIKGALPDPARQTAQFLKTQLQESGIAVDGKAWSIRENGPGKSPRHLISSFNSPPVKDLVHRLNKKSVNLYAEQLLKLIGKKKIGSGSYAAGLKAVTEWLDEKDLPASQIFLHDGSGLTRQNRVTTGFLARLLALMTAEPQFDDFYRSLPVAGDKNDISNLTWLGRGTPAANNVRVKTGTHARVRAFSGYVHTRSKRLLCFSMIANDYSGPGSAISRLHAKLLVALASLP